MSYSIKPTDPRFAHYLKIYGRTVGGTTARSRPNGSMRSQILARQGNQCMYCNNPFGWVVSRRGRPVELRLNWDHFVPYAFSGTNPGDNWIAACHVCNGIKGAKMFDTIIQAQQYITARWDEKGYNIVAVRPRRLANER